jgi:hypothetical protein
MTELLNTLVHHVTMAFGLVDEVCGNHVDNALICSDTLYHMWCCPLNASCGATVDVCMSV